MKKILAFLIVTVSFAFAANAQGVGGIEYTPYIPGSQGSNIQSQQVIRTNAYFTSGNNLYKIPIKVSLVPNVYGGGAKYVVSAYYVGGNNSIRYIPYGSGQDPDWQGCEASVSKTNRSSFSSQLENRFMYKAYVNGKYVYFDL